MPYKRSGKGDIDIKELRAFARKLGIDTRGLSEEEICNKISMKHGHTQQRDGSKQISAERVREDIKILEQFCRKLVAIDERDLHNIYYEPLMADLGKFIDNVIYTYAIPVDILSREITQTAITENCIILKDILENTV